MGMLLKKTPIEFVIGIAGLLVLSFMDALPKIVICPFLLLSGCECPTCGITRGLWLVTRGDFIAAWASNPGTFVLLIAYVRAMLGRLLPIVRKDRIAPTVLVACFLLCGMYKMIYQHRTP